MGSASGSSHTTLATGPQRFCSMCAFIAAGFEGACLLMRLYCSDMSGAFGRVCELRLNATVYRGGIYSRIRCLWQSRLEPRRSAVVLKGTSAARSRCGIRCSKARFRVFFCGISTSRMRACSHSGGFRRGYFCG